MTADVNIFALTDAHQEARKLFCLFSEITRRATQNGKDTLICDAGDLFKGIYDRELCVSGYEKLRTMLPEAKIVLALGNNDFGFNLENFKFLVETTKRFHQANIHVLCANLEDLKTGTCPKWVDPYIILEINHKKVMVTAFCVNQIRLQKYGVQLNDIPQTFAKMKDIIKHVEPDALVVLNHALSLSSEAVCQTAEECGVRVDLVIGGHEHSIVEPNRELRIYYPQAFSKTMLQFKLKIAEKATELRLLREINVTECPLREEFVPEVEDFENKAGLNTPVAMSRLNLEKKYSDPCSLGSFIADVMKKTARADIAMFSTGFTTHALRYEKNKMLTRYNIERVISAETPVQTVEITAVQLREALDNALRNRYIQKSGNVRFLQCSQNMTVVCRRNAENLGEVKQIYVNGEPLFDNENNPIYPEKHWLCAIDPFIGKGEQGFDVLSQLDKETLMKNNQLVKIKEIFTDAIKDAEHKYAEGSSYPSFKIIDEGDD